MACHDTHSRTQTGQPLWPGLISCHSRWSGDQGLLCGLLSDRTGPRRAPPDTDRTGTMCVCVCGGLGVHVREFDRDNENKEKKKKTRGDGEGYIRTSVHILPHRQAEGSSFYCKCGQKRCSAGVCIWRSLITFQLGYSHRVFRHSEIVGIHLGDCGPQIRAQQKTIMIIPCDGKV